MTHVLEISIEIKRLAENVFDMLAQMNIPNDPAKAKKQYEGAKYAYEMAIKELENLKKR